MGRDNVRDSSSPCLSADKGIKNLSFMVFCQRNVSYFGDYRWPGDVTRNINPCLYQERQYVSVGVGVFQKIIDILFFMGIFTAVVFPIRIF